MSRSSRQIPRFVFAEKTNSSAFCGPWVRPGAGTLTHRHVPNRFLALGNVQVATIESLAHHDLSIFEINVPPLKTKNLANPKRTEQRSHDHEPNVIRQSRRKIRRP
jgi:hypothetical protein